MLTLDLSSVVLESPNDTYTTLGQNLIGCSTLKSRVLQDDWLIMKKKATLNINILYYYK